MLRQHQMHVPAIRPPTVPPGTCRLRVSLSAAHSAADVDALVRAVRRSGAALQALPHLVEQQRRLASLLGDGGGGGGVWGRVESVVQSWAPARHGDGFELEGQRSRL